MSLVRITIGLLAVTVLSMSTQAGEVRISDRITSSNVDRAVRKARELANKGDRNITIVLSSPGGDLQAALRGFNAFRALGVNTEANADCSSSCTVLFAAGRRRSASGGTSFMFHAVNVERAPRGTAEQWKREFASRWLEAVRTASPRLASELQRNGTLLNGERTYSASNLRSYGYVND